MRLTKVEFNGYKRLRSTSCNFDGKIIAILGPNEAGKSSALNALTWLGEGERLPGYKRTRNADISDDAEVVRATFILSSEDRESFKHVEYEGAPTRFVLVRTAGGQRRAGALPEPVKVAEPFKAASACAAEVEQMLEAAFDDDPPEEISLLKTYLERQRKLFQEPDETTAEDVANLIDPLIDALKQVQSIPEDDYSDRTEKALVKHELTHLVDSLASLLETASTAIRDESPSSKIRRILLERCPQFILFTEDDRNLKTTYELADESTRSDPPSALANLLSVAETSADELFNAVQSNDKTRLRTLIRRANTSLEARLRPSWRQADLTVAINTDATTLEVLIEERDPAGAITAIDERSDGLRTFIALLCFLTVRPTNVQPILLIDEAETHLHLDAQADLVEVLSTQALAQQVIYTTHSPGCLPSDLGTGVRFIEPDPAEQGLSKLRNDFWQSSTPGYSPLLIAMGASAAAFSICRNAVLCEGPSEMILFPTLLRLANNLTQLPYQIAPGLSAARVEDIISSDIAARVVYLADGDSGGRKLLSQLAKAGVHDDQLLSLPSGLAIEDFIDSYAYLKVVSQLMREGGHNGTLPSATDLAGPGTIAKNLENWCTKAGIKAPGKTAVASQIVRSIEQKHINSEHMSELVNLHKSINGALAAMRARSGAGTRQVTGAPNP